MRVKGFRFLHSILQYEMKANSSPATFPDPCSKTKGVVSDIAKWSPFQVFISDSQLHVYMYSAVEVEITIRTIGSKLKWVGSTLAVFIYCIDKCLWLYIIILPRR